MYITCYMCVTSYMLQVLRDLNILTTVKNYEQLLRKVKIDHYVRKIVLLKIWKII